MEQNVTPSPILTQDVSPLFGGAGKPLSLPFPNPFVGLRPFKTEESLLFFGRNEQTIELLQRLHNTRFLAVVGSSGCGKSSLIRAGLIPKLKAGFLVEDRDRWLTAMMKPGDAPLRNLAECLDNELAALKRSRKLPRINQLSTLDKVLSNASPTDLFIQNILSSGAQAIIEKLRWQLRSNDTNLLLL